MSDRPTEYNSKKIRTRDLSSLPLPENAIAYEQRSLFSEGISRSSRLYDSGGNYGANHQMGAASLQGWKDAIAKYQSSLTTMIPASQTALFDLPDPIAIPMRSRPSNSHFSLRNSTDCPMLMVVMLAYILSSI